MLNFETEFVEKAPDPKKPPAPGDVVGHQFNDKKRYLVMGPGTTSTSLILLLPLDHSRSIGTSFYHATEAELMSFYTVVGRLKKIVVEGA